MPSAADVFAGLDQGKGQAPPPAPTESKSAADVFASLTPPPTMGERIKAGAEKAIEAVKPTLSSGLSKLKEMNRALSEQTQEQVFGPIADSFASAYVDFIQQGRDYQKGQTSRETLTQGAHQLLDMIQMTVGSWAPPVQKAVVDPIKAEIEKIGAKGDKYTQHDFEALADTFEMVYWAGFGGKSETPGPSAAKAAGRMALKDLREAVKPGGEVKPAPPKIEPVTVSLDKELGFRTTKDVVGREISRTPAGTTTTVGALVDKMLPSSEGYAKGFLEKLSQHMDRDVPVRFTDKPAGVEGYAGVYWAHNHSIEVKTNLSDPIHTVLHETVHSTTVSMLNSIIKGEIDDLKHELGVDELEDHQMMAVVNKPKSPVLRELDDVIKETEIRATRAGKKFPQKGRYAIWPMERAPAPKGMVDRAFARMAPRYEFLAEVFTNDQFQEFLANSEKYASPTYKWKNMLNQLGNLIGKHLGLKGGELRLLNQSMRVGTQLMKMQQELKPGKVPIESVVIGRLGDETITRGDVNRATIVGKKLDSPQIRKARSSLAISVEQILRAISPESLGRNAKLAAATIAKRITELEQRTAAWHTGSQTRLKLWRARPDLAKEFVQKFEKGERFSDPALDKIAKDYREWNQRIAEEDARLGLDYEPRDNYLYHVFEDQEGVANYFERKYGSKWGDPKFLKDRHFDLYEEAIKAGFRPRFTNPEDIMLARQHASDLAAMRVGILEDLERFGLATRKVAGKEEFKQKIGPGGEVSWEVERTEGTKQPEGTERRRSPNGDIFWVDKHADAVLRNAFDSKSLWADRGLGGMAFRGMMALKNTIVPIRLALSLFHPLHVAGIDMAAGYTRAMSEMLSGHIGPVSAFGKMLRSSFGPLFENPKMGWRVMKAWKGKIPAEKLTAEDAEALKILTETGIAPELSSQYRTNARQNFYRALQDAMADYRRGKMVAGTGDMARAAWHTPWALLSAMQKPIFEQWIPSLKAASAIKDAKSILARNPELVENDAQRLLAMRKIGKSVENRYGEMAYNKLFWQRWVKDLAVLDTLSLGWQLGFIREYGGGALDLGQFVKGGERLSRIKKGELDKALFVASYTTLGAGVAGLMTWAMTGETPSGMDYINPRTGEKNPDDSDQRVTTMFYSREFASLYKHIQNEGAISGVSDLVLNKGSGLFGLMHEWASGVNGFGQEIRDPSSPAFAQLEQTLAYTMADVEPISMKAMAENITEQPFKQGSLAVLGFNPQPKYMSETVTQAHIKAAFRNYVAPKETPYDKAQYSQDYTRLRQAYQSGSEAYGDLLDKMSDKYELSGADQRRIVKSLSSDLTPEQRMFMRLPWQEQKKQLDAMSEEEREEYLPHSNKTHLRGLYVPPEEK